MLLAVSVLSAAFRLPTAIFLRANMGMRRKVGRLLPGDQPRRSEIDLLRILQNAGEAVESLSDITALQHRQASLIADWSERLPQ